MGLHGVLGRRSGVERVYSHRVWIAEWSGEESLTDAVFTAATAKDDEYESGDHEKDSTDSSTDYYCVVQMFSCITAGRDCGRWRNIESG